jgi:hypothetical protein
MVFTTWGRQEHARSRWDQPFLEKISFARAAHPLLRSAAVSSLRDAKMNRAIVPLIASMAVPSVAINAWSPTPAIGAELVNRCRPLAKKLDADSPVAISTKTMPASRPALPMNWHSSFARRPEPLVPAANCRLNAPETSAEVTSVQAVGTVGVGEDGDDRPLPAAPQPTSTAHRTMDEEMRTDIGLALRRVGGENLLVLPPPRSGLLAVLWWAGIISFFIMAAAYTILIRLEAHRGGKMSARLANPSQLKILAWFLAVMVLVAAILLAIRVVPGT